MTANETHALLHVMVVGFHHKKGCQVEFSYPPLSSPLDASPEVTGDDFPSRGTGTSRLVESLSFEMPDEWRRLLPSLALPDGAHHWSDDAVFFTLPPKYQSGTVSGSSAIFGTSCCRQIDARELDGDKAEFTRNTVQKAICVLTSIPAYGVVEAHLKPVTQAYFEQKNFEHKDILQELFRQLASSLILQYSCPSPRSALAYLQEDSQLFVGLSARDFVLRFRHNFLLLIKLVLLERRILFFASPSQTPVLALTGGIVLTLLSLLPKMLEDGLYRSCELMPEGKTARGDFDDETAFSIKSGAASLASDFVIVTRRSSLGGAEAAAGNNRGDVSDFSASECSTDRMATLTDSAMTMTNVGFTSLPVRDSDPPAPDSVSRTEKDDSGFSGSGDSLPTRGGHFKASLKAPKRRVCGAGRDRSASPLFLNKEDLKRDDHLEAETQSLSSLCVEPPLSVNDNLEDRMEDLSLDEEEVGIETLNEEEGEDAFGADESFAFGGAAAASVSVQDNKCDVVRTTDFHGSNDTGEDALLDEIDRMMSASSKGKEKLGLDAISDEGVDERSAPIMEATGASPENEDAENALGIKHSDSKASILSERSVNLSARASLVKNKLFDVWKGGWGFGAGDGRFAEDKEESGGSSPSKGTGKGGAAELMSQSPSVEHLSIEYLNDSRVESATPEESTALAQDSFGFPLTIFEKGNVCYPYASLQHLDVVQGDTVRGFVIGATNILFKQKIKLSDVVISIETIAPVVEEEPGAFGVGSTEHLPEGPVHSFDIEWHDHDLKRLVALTTADLRFADQLLRQVEAVEDSSVWEGGDEWIRAQVKTYLQSLLVASVKGDQNHLHDFNPAFVFALQNTHNYRVWRRRGTGPEVWPGLEATEPSHPGASPHLSVGDIKLKVSHTMSSSQSGRKITAAAANTGKAVVSTSKVVGGAIVNARTSISSWWHGGKRTKYEDEDVAVEDSSATQEMSE